MDVSWNVPLAPLPGAVNVTLTPLTGLPTLSSTVAFKGLGKENVGAARCTLPLRMEMLAAGPGVVYSNEPMSQLASRVTPRWSSVGQLVEVPALIAGLPANSA